MDIFKKVLRQEHGMKLPALLGNNDRQNKKQTNRPLNLTGLRTDRRPINREVQLPKRITELAEIGFVSIDVGGERVWPASSTELLGSLE